MKVANHMRGLVFGGMDGILTTFALLAAVAGSSQTTPNLILVIGTSTVLADALSMAAGEFLSAKAEAELDPAAAAMDVTTPMDKGIAMFIAFTLFGSMPLLSYVITRMTATPQNGFSLSIAITGATLFGLGMVKSSFGPGIWWRSGVEVTAIGGAAATVAYFTAQIVDYFMVQSS